MYTQIKTAYIRSQDTLLQDAIGAVSIVLILLVALHLPSFY
jgi:hypothetical protein